MKRPRYDTNLYWYCTNRTGQDIPVQALALASIDTHLILIPLTNPLFQCQLPAIEKYRLVQAMAAIPSGDSGYALVSGQTPARTDPP